MSRRSLTIALALVVTLALTITALALALTRVRTGSGAQPQPAPVSTPPAAASGAPAPVPPRTGALLGAWVKPDQFTDAGRIAALDGFTRSVGRPLDVVQDYHKWNDEFPDEFDRTVAHSGAIPLISWGGTDTHLIAVGDDDEVIHQRAQALKAWRAPVLLRWRWEMDRPNLAGEVHGPAEYIAAWKRIRAVFRAERVSNVSFVWCPLAEGFGSGKAQDYYPGSDQVDWLCADAYTLDPGQPLEDLLAPFLSWAQPLGKPIVIAEFGSVPGKDGQRAAWISAVPALVAKYPQLKALLYFDADTQQRTEERRWSLRWDQRDVQAFAGLARDPALNTRHRRITPG
jgi:hypothetical protein